MSGLALVMSARPDQGFALLDEAAAAALAGDISDPYAAGLTCCYLISACDRVRDYDRAAQWCARLREFSTRQLFAILMTTCRLQYGSVLISRGDWADAEAELQAAIADLREVRPVVLPAAYARLGELRRRQGRTDEAIELFERAGSHPLALLGGAWIEMRAVLDPVAEPRRSARRTFGGEGALGSGNGAIAPASTGPMEDIQNSPREGPLKSSQNVPSAAKPRNCPMTFATMSSGL